MSTIQTANREIKEPEHAPSSLLLARVAARLETCANSSWFVVALKAQPLCSREITATALLFGN